MADNPLMSKAKARLPDEKNPLICAAAAWDWARHAHRRGLMKHSELWAEKAREIEQR
jgi:hypothetical protein